MAARSRGRPLSPRWYTCAASNRADLPPKLAGWFSLTGAPERAPNKADLVREHRNRLVAAYGGTESQRNAADAQREAQRPVALPVCCLIRSKTQIRARRFLNSIRLNPRLRMSSAEGGQVSTAMFFRPACELWRDRACAGAPDFPLNPAAFLCRTIGERHEQLARPSPNRWSRRKQLPSESGS